MRFQVILHEGVVDGELHATLADGLRRIYAGLFSVAETEIDVGIDEIPSGLFFTAAKPSSSSIVAGTVPLGTSKDDRTRLLSEICDMWCDVTGCTPGEIVATAADAAA